MGISEESGELLESRVKTKKGTRVFCSSCKAWTSGALGDVVICGLGGFGQWSVEQVGQSHHEAHGVDFFDETCNLFCPGFITQPSEQLVNKQEASYRYRERQVIFTHVRVPIDLVGAFEVRVSFFPEFEGCDPHGDSERNSDSKQLFERHEEIDRPFGEQARFDLVVHAFSSLSFRFLDGRDFLLNLFCCLVFFQHPPDAESYEYSQEKIHDAHDDDECYGALVDRIRGNPPNGEDEKSRQDK